ncbi:MAG TPA: hypothetical protein VND87_01385 [Stellaceae bacterium]|nr:hypothetical protein [Stellaceae bacterium]
MRVVGLLSAWALVGVVGGCAYPGGQQQYNPMVYEQPQRVDFFYGTIIAARRVTVGQNDASASVSINPRSPIPFVVGVHAGPRGPSGADAGLSVGPLDVFADAAVPNVPAIEYTVLLDKKTYPPDPYLNPAQSPAIIVVQNYYPDDLPLAVGYRAFVRVVGNTAHVMRADSLPFGVEPAVSAGPMPVPLAYNPAPAPEGCPSTWLSAESQPETGGPPETICYPYYDSQTVNVF